ncbi:GNAT family N-acetyltransferase [Belnapia sp. T18]|uniref:GNAT family N-acetyltransferase n=1 Tax=Belnapia arida TaxID=2804533 RepID=A0ABS1U6L9_9PROT|nr:GNAT family N-acetyltransferase [Belnapia arida]MBL6080303.1 GNAT family N-acetyltransferase [Belnapia arida]
MVPHIRPAMEADANEVGRIMHDAFRGVAEAHGFHPDLESVEEAANVAAMFIASPTIFGVVAEHDGQIIGSNFLAEGDPVRTVVTLTIEPRFQGRGVGRMLMEAVLERARSAASVRLVADAFNIRSVPLYASMGFEVKEPLLLMRGTPQSGTSSGYVTRPLSADDVAACEKLAKKVYGTVRTSELQDAVKLFKPFVAEKDRKICAYLSSAGLWLANHGIAETEADMRALIAGTSALTGEPISFLLPVRQASLFQWCICEGFRVVKPMLLMSKGEYVEPNGVWFPSVSY